MIDLDKGLFIAVADLPLDKYNESAISSGLANLDWVSRVIDFIKVCPNLPVAPD